MEHHRHQPQQQQQQQQQQQMTPIVTSTQHKVALSNNHSPTSNIQIAK